MAIHPVSEQEKQVFEKGVGVLELARQKSGLKARWFDSALNQLMEDEALRTQTLRFIDVLPALDSDEDLLKHLREYFGEEQLALPSLLKWIVQQPPLPHKPYATFVRRLLLYLFRRYMGGANAVEALATVKALRQQSIGFSLDRVGEAVVSEQEADLYQQHYLRLIEELPPKVADWPKVARLDEIDGEEGPRLYLSLKLTSLYSQMNPLDPEGSIERIALRLRPLLNAAKRNRVGICFDMEQYDYKEIVLACFKQLLMEPELRDWPHGAIAMQAYLKDSERDLAQLIEWAGERGTPVTVRLVRGAYWDYETVIAKQHHWPIPVWEQKWQTDSCYERCLQLLLESHPYVRSAIATHNVRSLALAMTLAEKNTLSADQFEFQMLYGMGGALQNAVATLGYCLRIYVPFGEPVPGMAYLVRRLLENASSQSFQRMNQLQEQTPEQLLAPPSNDPAANMEQPVQQDAPQTLPPFTNEPGFRFADPLERQRFSRAIEKIEKQLGATYPVIIDGQAVATHEAIISVNPARPDQVVGKVGKADQKLAEKAIEGATSAFEAWSRKSMAERAQYLLKAADLMRERRAELAAFEIFEAGKTWREADANITEAIDFLAYYARQAIRLGQPQARNVPGETNLNWYRPRGVGIIIPPWNFPTAILTGMLSAAVVTGNTVLLKPSSQTPVIGAQVVKLLHEAGLPPGVVQFVPGSGRLVGEYAVQHPGIHFVAFTGSQEVGTRIIQLAAAIAPGQQHVKRVIAEMGGKNAIIVDHDADLDEAVSGIVQSAFGYQGQKCSACARVIVVGSHYETLKRRLVEATRSLEIGDPKEPDVFLGPVIEQAARDRILKAIEEGKDYAELALQIDCSGRDGYFVGPAIFSRVPSDSPLAQKEIFGPVLAMMQAQDLEEALQIANNTAYALTGGFYSRSPANIQKVQREFQVGNLYVNRKISGALVDRQPFGGFKLSGSGSKAGGPDYLLQFVIPRTFTENTLRRGFAPLEDITL